MVNILTPDQSSQRNIYNTIKNLEKLPKVVVQCIRSGKDIKEITVTHGQEYVPDFYFKWCPSKQYFHVHIYVASTTEEKRHVGYSICTIPSGLAAIGFCTMYSFLHKHRANNKSSAE